MPYCPACRDEYAESAAVCPRCGLPLAGELPPLPEIDDAWTKSEGMWPENWPEGEDGAPEKSALILDTASETELNNALMKLRGYAMPSFAVAANGAMVSPVVFGFNMMGGKLYVPASLLDDARELLSPPPGDEISGVEEDGQ